MRFKRNDDIVMRTIAGECILVSINSTSMLDSSLKILNDTGAFLWEQLDRTRTIDELVTIVSEEYNGTSEKIRKEIITFVNDLVEKKLILKEM